MRGWHMFWLSALALSVSNCLIGDDVCGAHQHRIDEGYQEGCVCDQGAVPNVNGVGCQRCESHEVATAGTCVCEPGYARTGSGMTCELKDADAGTSEPTTRGQDMMCKSSADCEGLDATYCLTLQSPTRCLVQGCLDGTHRCASDRDCCVITVLPELAATRGLCVPTGTCTAPGMVVHP